MWGIDDHLWQGLISSIAVVVAGAGLAAAVTTWRAVRAGEGDPHGRVAFLAVTSLSAALVFLLLTLMTGFAVVSLEPCRG